MSSTRYALFFIYLLVTLIDYEKKGSKWISKGFTILQTYLFIYFILHLFIFLYIFSTKFGLYKSYPLNRNLALEICKKRDTISLV
jgi:hypothetical protein